MNIAILLLWKYLKGFYACLSSSPHGQIDSKQGTLENKKKPKNRDSVVRENTFLSNIKVAINEMKYHACLISFLILKHIPCLPIFH
jgi:hypothetical protein